MAGFSRSPSVPGHARALRESGYRAWLSACSCGWHAEAPSAKRADAIAAHDAHKENMRLPVGDRRAVSGRGA